MRDVIKRVKFKLQKRKFKLSNSFRQFEKRLCTPDYFRRLLAIERRRTERLNYKSSIVIFNLRNCLINSNKIASLDFEHFIEVVQSCIRETDEVCFFKNHILLVLLPATDNIGSQHVCEKIFDKLTDKYLSPQKYTYKDFDVEILIYPSKQTNGKLPKELNINKTDIDNGKINDKKSDTIISNYHNFNKNHVESLNLFIFSSNGSSIAIPVVYNFFWDIQLLSNIILFLKKGIKRSIDVLGSLIGLILLSPIFILIALLIRLTSNGPILFKQKRVGYKGKLFTFVKFRSMHFNCDTNSHCEYMKKLINGNTKEINNGHSNNPLYKMKNDKRITPVGKFLRKTSLDEFPQLINVLMGDMSLVGPRPPIPYEVNEYQNWHYRRVLDVKPGITGLWQVSGRNKTTFDEMVRLDIHYANNWSLVMDIKILLKTIKCMIFSEGV